jgi:hypothetical protein
MTVSDSNEAALAPEQPCLVFTVPYEAARHRLIACAGGWGTLTANDP